MSNNISTKHLGNVLAVRIKLNDRTIPHIINPYKIDGDTVYFRWFEFGTWCTADITDIKIITDYGIKTKNIKRNDEILADFLKANYPAKPTLPLPDDKGEFYGYIAPNGDYYLALYRNHTTIARNIVLELEGVLMSGIDAQRHLEKEWLWLRERSKVHGRLETYDLTKAQEKTLTYIDENFDTSFMVRATYRKYA